MYDRRIKIFIGITIGLLAVCVLRLVQLQLLADPSLRAEIDRLKERRALSKQLKTLRGRIIDRHGEVVATDIPRFQIYVNYRLSRHLDDRLVDAKLAEAQSEREDPALLGEVREEIEDRQRDLDRVIEKCAHFGTSRQALEDRIRAVNGSIWNLRAFVAWRRSSPDPNLLSRYDRIVSVPLSEAMADFARQFPDPNERDRRILAVDDLPELEKDLPLLELETDDDLFAAQIELAEMADVEILPTGHRHYPYGTTAAQTIGWVGPATQPRDRKLFANDRLASYLLGEVCGREDGVEYVCETVLRGWRGELVYDIDRQLVREIEPRYGQDVQLTLDIRLQQRIEAHLSDPEVNPGYYDKPFSVAIIDIPSGDILALVSLPNYDLNRVRYEYGELVNDPNRPLINRTINRLYPPGSVVKPLILIGGLEAGLTTPDEVIGCPAAPAPAGWPNCWIWKQYKGGHNNSWTNNARNAIKGSCNIYFSRLADRLEPRGLQKWLFRFGYGREVPLFCPEPPPPGRIRRRFKQAPGQIGSTLVSSYADVESLKDIPPLEPWERKLFGIGHGNFRVTPLQVADTFATLARGGRRKPPCLFLDPEARETQRAESVDLDIAPATLQLTTDGLDAVVNERGGTAYQYFKPADLARQGVKVYGKTGSTERPDNAWFAGYAEDAQGARIALAVVVEGGMHGSSDAAPLGREVLQCCVEAGYVGTTRPASGPPSAAPDRGGGR